jgi:multidrug transporter EmrE-like cation transporter
MEYSAYGLLLIAILFGAVGQIFLKSGMNGRPGFQIRNLWSLILDVKIVGGFLSYGVSTLLYLRSLADLDLSLAYPTVSLGYVMILLLSRKFFNEPVNSTRWIAVFIICLGISLVGLGVK